MILDINNKEKILLGHNNKRQAVFASHKEIIENVLKQEAEDIQPLYSFYDYKTKEIITPPGFLVYSLWAGCGVVYRRNGEMILVQGVQGDFCCTL